MFDGISSLDGWKQSGLWRLFGLHEAVFAVVLFAVVLFVGGRRTD